VKAKGGGNRAANVEKVRSMLNLKNNSRLFGQIDAMGETVRQTWRNDLKRMFPRRRAKLTKLS
jgi:hypothetical protein